MSWLSLALTRRPSVTDFDACHPFKRSSKIVYRVWLSK